MFRVAQVVGNGSFQQILEMDSTKEGAIHSIVVNNPSGAAQTITFDVGVYSFQYEISDKTTEIRDMKINVPVATGVNVTVPAGVKVTAFYVEMAIDPASSLSAAQSIAKEIFDQAALMKATLPEGTIFDGDPREDATWSSYKIDNEIRASMDNIKYYTANDVEVGSFMYFAHTKFDGSLYGGSDNPTSTTRLNYDGNLHATTFVEPSDIRLKENITAIDDALSKVNKLSGYTYTMKHSNEQKTGLIAQEVMEVIPEAVTGNESDGYGVAYGNLVGLLVQAINELSAKVKKLEGK